MDNRILISGKKIVLVSILVLLIGFMTIGKVFAEDGEKGDANAISPSSIPPAAPIQKGDINGDEKVTVSDLSLLKAYIVGINEIEKEYRIYCADMNGDGKVTVTDLSSLKIKLVGLDNVGAELDINSKQVQELMRYVPDDTKAIFESIERLPDAYSSRKITIDDVGNNVILKMAFYNIQKEVKVGVNTFSIDGAGTEEELRKHFEEGNLHGEGPWYKFKEEVLEATATRIYGKKVNIKHENIELYGVNGCSYNSAEKMYIYSFGRWRIIYVSN